MMVLSLDLVARQRHRHTCQPHLAISSIHDNNPYWYQGESVIIRQRYFSTPVNSEHHSTLDIHVPVRADGPSRCCIPLDVDPLSLR